MKLKQKMVGVLGFSSVAMRHAKKTINGHARGRGVSGGRPPALKPLFLIHACSISVTQDFDGNKFRAMSAGNSLMKLMLLQGASILETIQCLKIFWCGDVCDYARTHSNEQTAQIMALIAEFGLVNPILVDKDHGIQLERVGDGRTRAEESFIIDNR
ncbi:MAG: hypothetical protein ACK5VE_04245 [Alphaproteobacteria bacterium]